MKRLHLDVPVLGLIALALAVRLWGVADRLPDPSLGINPIVANTAYFQDLNGLPLEITCPKR